MKTDTHLRGQDWDDDNLTNFFDGEIDEMVFYDHALTTSEVAASKYTRNLYENEGLDILKYEEFIETKASYTGNGSCLKYVRSNRNPVRFNKKDIDITLVFGINLTICNIIRLSLSPSIACDNNTGVAFVNTIAGGTGTPNTGGSLYITMTDVKYVEVLQEHRSRLVEAFRYMGHRLVWNWFLQKMQDI